MRAILDARGLIGVLLLQEFVTNTVLPPLVGRHGSSHSGATESIAANLSAFRQSVESVAGPSIVCFDGGLQ